MSADAPSRAPVYPAFGALGVGMLLLFSARLVLMLGPSGDLRVAFFDVLGVGMALVPSWGWMLWRERRPLRAAGAWLFGSILALGFLPPLAIFVRSS